MSHYETNKQTEKPVKVPMPPHAEASVFTLGSLERLSAEGKAGRLLLSKGREGTEHSGGRLWQNDAPSQVMSYLSFSA